MELYRSQRPFKDGRLLIRLSKPIVHVLELNALGPGIVVQLAQAVWKHLPELQGVPGRVGLPVAPGPAP